MGSGPSRHIEWSNLESHPLIVRLCSERITSADPLWNQLLSFRVPIMPEFNPQHEKGRQTRALPADSLTEFILSFSVVSGVCRSFLAASRNNRNIFCLIDQFLIRHGEVVTAVECDDPIFPWHVANCLYIIRRVFLHLIQHFDEATVLDIFHQKSSSSDIIMDMIDGIIVVLDAICLFPEEKFVKVYGFVVEALSLLLILLSSQMYNASPAFQSHFSKVFNDVNREKLVRSLVLLMANKKADPRIEVISKNSGFVFGVLEFFSGGKESGHSHGVFSVSRLAEALLLVLANLPQTKTEPDDNCEPIEGDKGVTAKCNSIKDLIFAATPSGETEEGAIQLPFSKIYESLIQSQERESGTLLLYTLLHENASFRTFVLSKTDVDRLVIPLLKILHCAASHSGNHVYMSLVVLLILSEEDSWCRQVNEIIVSDSDVAFYIENQATSVKLFGINLGSLILLTIVRMIQFNLSRVKDQYLHTNCLAALANMSSRYEQFGKYDLSDRFGLKPGANGIYSLIWC